MRMRRAVKQAWVQHRFVGSERDAIPAFTARRGLQHGASRAPAAIDRYLPAANPPAAVAVDRWNRSLTGGRTDRQRQWRN